MFLDLLHIYEKEIRKNTKNKRKVYLFEIYKMCYIKEIENILESKNRYICFYKIFLIFEPKVRVVMSLPIKDKVLNHYVTRYILTPKLEKYLDERNVATRKDMGVGLARKLFKKYLCKMKNKNFYILKMDIEKYFYSIDHEVLKRLLKDKLSEKEFTLIKDIIDSTNTEYIHKKIEFLEKKYGIELPKYEYGKGLPIGNMTSQFLSVFYLYKLDHKIIYDYHLKYYIKYMDDFVILHENKQYLENIFLKIKEELESVYKLKINKKKSKIVNSREGITFLGIHYKIKKNKIVEFLPNKKKQAIKKKIKKNFFEFKNNMKNIESLFSSRECFLHSYKVSRKYIKELIYEMEKN